MRLKSFYKWGQEIGRSNPDTWIEVRDREKAALAKQQEPHLVRFQLEASQLKNRESELTQEIAIHESQFTPLVKHGWFYMGMAAVLFVASFALLWLTFEPFRLGYYAHIFSVGASVATAVFFHLFLDTRKKKESRVLFSVSANILAILILIHVLLGIIRAEILQEVMNQSTQQDVIIENATTQTSTSPEGFYKKTLPLLSFVLPLFGLAVEIATGAAFHCGFKHLFHPAIQKRRELRVVQQRMTAGLADYRYRQLLPETFEEEFTAGARQAVTEKDRSEEQIAKWIPIMLTVILLIAILTANLFAGSAGLKPKHIVIAIDLSKSREQKDFENRSEFEKDISTVQKITAGLNQGTKITIIGITDQSFGNPFLILDAKVSMDPGYFGERLRNARAAIQKSWKKKSETLKPEFLKTDIIGALNLASQIFATSGNYESVLILMSDMRHDTKEMSFEKMKVISPKLLELTEESRCIPELKGAKVYVLGATSGNKLLEYWRTLRAYWAGFFEKSGARLIQFSVGREFGGLEAEH